MTTEQLLIAAISAVTGALVFVAKLLWSRSELCERDRYDLREEVEALKEALGLANGTLKAFDRCPQATCPFKDGEKPVRAAVKGAAAGVVVGLIIFAAFALSGCNYKSPGAKNTTHLNVSLTSPAYTEENEGR